MYYVMYKQYLLLHFLLLFTEVNMFHGSQLHLDRYRSMQQYHPLTPFAPSPCPPHLSIFYPHQ